MERSGDRNPALLMLIFAASFASLAYEMALMRIFSVSLWYHFAFMVISIAMLGIGASGTFLSIYPGLKAVRRIALYALFLAIAIPASYLLANIIPFDPARLSWDRLQLLAIGLYYVVLCVPFFCFGLIVSTAYSALSHDANAIYASDLMGAGAGALIMVKLLSLGGPETSVLIISAFLAMALICPSTTRAVRLGSLLLLAADMALLYVHPAFLQTRISPYKPLSIAMQFPGAEHLGTAYSSYSRVDLFKSPAVRFAPGLSFTYRQPLPQQIGIAVDAGDIHAVIDETDSGKLAFIYSLPGSIAYRMGKNDDVLVIEPLAGYALLMARLFGAKNVSAIDSNPLMLRMLEEYGRIHALPVLVRKPQSGLARTWLTSSDRTFDLIDISLMGSWPSAAYGFAEDYRFTIEAFRQYLTHLKSNGLLSLTLYTIPPPRMELRLVATLAGSAEGCGITDISRHVAAIRSWDTLTILLKRSPLTREDVRLIKTFAREMRFDLVYYPGIARGESNVYIRQPGNEYAEAFQQVLENTSRERFMNAYLFDIRPATDDMPFFHYYLKIGSIKAIYRVMGEKWQYFIDEGYLLPVLLVQVLLVGALLIVLPVVKLRSERTVIGGQNLFRTLSYFALLGIAYLFIEVVFIQNMTLGLGNPSYSACTVIASVLIGSGIGSLMSQRVRLLNNPRVLLLLAGIVVIYSFLLPGFVSTMGRYEMVGRIMISGMIVMPAGVLMGIPFPLGMASLGAGAPRLIAWAWAVNGCFSVIAPILAVMLALSFGFRIVLLTGSAMYILAFAAIVRRWNASTKEGSSRHSY